MGLTFADIQNMSKEGTALYPEMEVPLLNEYTEDEKRIAELQLGFSARLRKSAYYITELTKSNELPRYSDKYRPSPASQPTLKRKDLHQPFFPQEIFEGYFNPKKRKLAQKSGPKKRINLDDLEDDGADKEDGEEDRSEIGSQADEEDYDAEEDYGDNDYAENYFDPGEDDDNDALGAGGGDEGGGGYDYD
ncbi:hypothetical protein QCA50_015503 [Cerrena zonata]|uniref:DNA-directed RNA polymerase III subunit n=1 Tax=Cerrena zonata TaxID=2478898 RepID=A0AAW0FLC2_9APHY